MTDIKLQEYASLEGVTMDFLLLDTGMLDEREQLATAARVALGTDRLVDVNEVLPDPDSTDRRGWWGDMDAEEIWDGWPIGTKNWLLTRAKITDNLSSEGATLERARRYTQECLQPFIDKGMASQLMVSAARTDTQRIEVGAKIYRGPIAEIDLRYQLLWTEMETDDAPLVQEPISVKPPRFLAYALIASSPVLGAPQLSTNSPVHLPRNSFSVASAIVIGSPAFVAH